MAMNDGEFVYSSPLDTQDNIKAEPVTTKKEVAIRDSTSQFATGNLDLVNTYMEAYEADPVIRMNNMTEEAKDAAMAGTADAAYDMAGEQPEQLSQVAGQLPDVAQEAADQYDVELGPELAYVDSLGMDFIDDKERKSVAADMYIRRKLGEKWDKDLWGTFTDMDALTAMLLPIQSAYQAKFLKEAGAGEGNAFKDYLRSGDGIAALSRSLMALEPEDRVIAFQQLEDAAEATTGNKFEQLILLMSAAGLTTEQEEESFAASEKLGLFFGGAANMAKTVSVLRRVSSGIRAFKKAPKVASTVFDTASRSEDAANAVATTRLDAAMSGVPMRDLEVINEGAAPEIADQIKKNVDIVDKLFAESKNIAREGVMLTPEEQSKFAQRIHDEYMARPEISNVAVKQGKDGVDIQYDVIDPMTDKVKLRNVKPETIKYNQDAVTGGFHTDKVSLMSKLTKAAVSPNTSLGKDRDFFVRPFNRVLGQRAKIRNAAAKSINQAVKGLNKESLERVDHVLMQGTLKDEVFSYRDLVKGGRPDLPQLTDQEFKSYATFRRIADQGWEMMNEDMYRQLQYRGNKTVIAGDKSAYAKVYDDANAAKRGYNARRENFVWKPDTNEVVKTVNPEDVDNFYAEGYRLTYLDSPSEFWEVEQQGVKFALVKAENITDLDPVVLNKRRGYMPIMYEGLTHFVKEEVPMWVDGKARGFNRTLRGFDSVKDAEEYAADLMKQNPQRKVKVLRDHEIDAAEREADIVNMYGGKFRSARAEERIRVGKEGAEASYTSPIDALSQYLGNVSLRYPTSELKLALQDRWMNQAAEYVGSDIRTKSFNSARGIVEQQVEDTRVREKLLTAHDQVTQMQSVMSKEELDTANTIKSIAEEIDRGGSKKLAQGMYRLSQRDPSQFAKGATFNMLLGLFNPAQLMVQAMGASVAMSLHPTYALKGFQRYSMLHFLDLAELPELNAQTLKKLSKVDSGIGEFYDAWRKSGLKESVVSAQGDFSVAASGVPITKSLLQRTMEKGRIFFEHGELFNARMSFSIAYDEWKAANKGRKVDDAALKQIVSRSDDYRMNMSQANRAWFQRGWTAIPTQFLQVATKSVEAMLGTHLTNADKLKLLAGQMTMFGANGVPFGEMAVDNMLKYAEVQPEDISPETIVAMKQGSLGLLMESMDLDVEVASRFGNLNAMEETLVQLFGGDYSLPELLAGPTGGVYGRVFGFGSKQLGFVENMVFAGKTLINADELNAQDAINMAKFTAVSLGEIPTSTRNAIVAYLMYNGQAMIKSNGQPLWQQDVTMGQAMTKALGFSPRSINDYYTAQDFVKVKGNLKSNYTKLATNLINKMALAWDNNDEAGVRASKLAMDWIDSAFADDPEGLYQLRKSVIEELLSGQETKHEFIRKMILKQMRSGDTFSSSAQEYNIDSIKQLHGEE